MTLTREQLRATLPQAPGLFILPWPPSVNRYYRSFQGRAIISREGRRYRETVGAYEDDSQIVHLSVTKHAACPPGRVEVQVKET